MSSQEIRYCAICGRVITWRKKWERDWPDVRYCSKSCRRRKLNALDDQIESTLVAMLKERGERSVCPSEVARRIDPSQWRGLLERVRMAGRRLASSGAVEFTQRGRVIDPSIARGPIRIRRRRR
jgi:hypothetical protein